MACLMIRLIAPRPIGISTLGKNGVANLAPYSAFNMVSNNPHMVMFSGNLAQHSTKHAIETQEFVVNVVPRALAQEMNLTSRPIGEGESEFDLTGLQQAPCEKVKAPRVAKSPVSLECTFHSATTLPAPVDRGVPSVVVFGLVVGIHIDDGLITESGRVDLTPIAPFPVRDILIMGPLATRLKSPDLKSTPYNLSPSAYASISLR